MKKAIALAIVILFLISPANALYKEGSDSKGKYSIEDRKNYPIIFIPGVAGSELYCGDKNAWPGWLPQRATGGYFKEMEMDENGRSKCNLVPLRSIRKGLEFDLSFLGAYGIFGVYDDFFDYMGDEGYSLEESKETGLRYYDFAYDWRNDNHHTADLLDEKIDKVLKDNKADKAILMAHSMGGVIARLYMRNPERAKKVAGVIFMGTPHQGAPMPFYAYTHGYNFGNSKISDTTMWEIMGNWEAGYQLIPGYPYVQDAETGEFWPVEKIYGSSWISQQEYKHYKADPQNWKLRYGLPNRGYASKTVQFQNELGGKLDKYPWVKYYMIEGTEQDTVQYFIGKLEWKDDIDFKDEPKRPVLVLEKVITKQGDGTVPARGAKVEGLDGHFNVKTDHGSIPSFADTHPILTDLRKKLNDEYEREIRIRMIEAYAKGKLSQVQSWPDSGSVFRMLKSGLFFFFKPDEEKIKLREEIRGDVKEMLKWAHVNIVVAEGTLNESRYYVIINDYNFIEAGAGTIKPSTALVKIDNHQTFADILLGTKDIKEAYDKGEVKVRGVGLTTSFKLKVFQWFSKYGR